MQKNAQVSHKSMILSKFAMTHLPLITTVLWQSTAPNYRLTLDKSFVRREGLKKQDSFLSVALMWDFKGFPLIFLCNYIRNLLDL